MNAARGSKVRSEAQSVTAVSSLIHMLMAHEALWKIVYELGGILFLSGELSAKDFSKFLFLFKKRSSALAQASSRLGKVEDDAAVRTNERLMISRFLDGGFDRTIAILAGDSERLIEKVLAHLKKFPPSKGVVATKVGNRARSVTPSRRDARALVNTARRAQ